MDRFTKAAVMTGVTGALSIGLLQEVYRDDYKSQDLCYEHFNGEDRVECLDEADNDEVSGVLAVVALAGITISVFGVYEMVRLRNDDDESDPISED